MSCENKTQYKRNTVWVTARQRNHDNYSLPVQLTHLLHLSHQHAPCCGGDALSDWQCYPACGM